MINILSLAPPVPDDYPGASIEKAKNGQGVGSWVHQDKHTLLCKFLIGSHAAAKRFPSWVFIDPFCGPGRLQVKGESFTRPNGAMIAWLQSIECGRPFDVMLINDFDSNRTEACKKRLELKGMHNVIAFSGPAKDVVPKMIEQVPIGALCTVYLDPYNLALLNYEMISALSTLKYVDFVINFSTMDLMRNGDLELDPSRARFDEVLPGWSSSGPIAKQRLQEVFISTWMQKIESLGFTFSNSAPMINNDDHRGIYRLMCFARHEIPLRVWRDISRNATKDLFS
ncbi:three-Cys-motif partner protein TcmP [Methylobacillus sp.]|uniref:three-Cys-motif partner protein TcmP n=1 Tax=Methylobacillus sp. TaxID=56818 RepID=UPI002FE0804D